MSRKPIALDAYEAMSEAYAAKVDTKPHNAYYERPATLSLLPEVAGKRVLDVGCGPGVYAEWLAEHGAEVVALDASPKVVSLAKERLGSKAQVLQADFGRPLGFLPDGSFDLVLSALAFDYVEDWAQVFREFYRLLRCPGHLVFSAGHPFADFMLYPEGNYFDIELVHWEWRGFGVPVTVPAYRRPLGGLINPLLQAGFLLERILEPVPTERFREQDPEEYDKLSRQPGFMCVRAAKR